MPIASFLSAMPSGRAWTWRKYFSSQKSTAGFSCKSKNSWTSKMNWPQRDRPHSGSSISSILSILELRSAVLQFSEDFDALFKRLATRDLHPIRRTGADRSADEILRSHRDCFPLGPVPILQPPNGKVIKP